MANRNLQAKFERSRRQAREAAHVEFSKSGYTTARPFESDNGPVNFRRAEAWRPHQDYFADRATFVRQRIAGLNPGKAYVTPERKPAQTAFAAAAKPSEPVGTVRLFKSKPARIGF